MRAERQQRIARILEKMPQLTDGQVYWLDKVIEAFSGPFSCSVLKSDLIDQLTLCDFGDALRIHHTFSSEPFSKDKFEYVLAQVLEMNGHEAKLAPKGNRGFDLEVDGERISLKTQADKGIKTEALWISKFMELGRGEWGDDPKDLVRLRAAYLEHLRGYDRVFVLRALSKKPDWHYELVEIPMEVLQAAATGKLEMRLDSAQYPKPGYCYVHSSSGEEMYRLYFDAGSERKLQVKDLRKEYCIIHADWRFSVTE